MPLFPDIIQDAEGRPRHLYNVRAWWRSPSIRADIPRATYEAICDDVKRTATVPDSSAADKLESPSRRLVLPAVLCLLVVTRSPLSITDVLLVILAVIGFVVAALPAPAWRWIGQRTGIRLLQATDEQIARAMLAHGHCPSCAHLLDLQTAVATADVTVRCPECGAAWHAPPAGELNAPPPVPTL